MQKKIRMAASETYGDPIARQLFHNTMTRCIRGRWLSISNVVGFLRPMLHYIGNVFTRALRNQVAVKASVPVDKGLYADEATEYRAKMGMYRTNTLSLANDALFKGMVVISDVVAGPLTHCYAWAFKRNGETKKKHAEADGAIYGGKPC